MFRRLILVSSLQLALSNCGSDATGTDVSSEPGGTIAVTTRTSGDSPDPDGYRLDVDGVDAGVIGTNETRRLVVVPGDHAVGLTGLERNCVLPGASQVTVSVVDRGTAEVDFPVSCPTLRLRSVEIILQTRGTPEDPDGYVLTIAGMNQITVSSNDTVMIAETLASGLEVTLSGQAPNCVPVGALTRTLLLSDTSLTRLFFTIECFNSPILFQRSVALTDLWIVESDGSREVNLTDGAGDNRLEFTGAPGTSWTSDHQRVLFVSDRNGDWDVYVMRLNKSGLRRYAMPGNQVEAAWSRDGSRIAYVSDEAGNLDIWTMDTSGVGMTRVTQSALDERYPGWSPGGDKVTFIAFQDPYRETYIANSDGTGTPSNLTNAPRTGDVTHDYSPYWSNDGSQLVFRRVTFDSVTHALTTDDIYLYAPDGSGLLNVTQRPTQSPMLRVAWHPVEAELAVVQCDGLVPNVTGCELRLIPNTGGVGVSIGALSFGSGSPTFSPDSTFSGPVTPGSRLALSCPGPSSLEVCVIDRNSGSLQMVTLNDKPDNLPRWQ